MAAILCVIAGMLSASAILTGIVLSIVNCFADTFPWYVNLLLIVGGLTGVVLVLTHVRRHPKQYDFLR